MRRSARGCEVRGRFLWRPWRRGTVSGTGPIKRRPYATLPTLACLGWAGWLRGGEVGGGQPHSENPQT